MTDAPRHERPQRRRRFTPSGKATLVGSAGIIAAAIVASSALASTDDSAGSAPVDLGGGAYITSPDGTRYLITVTDGGQLVETPVSAAAAAPTSASSSPATSPSASSSSATSLATSSASPSRSSWTRPTRTASPRPTRTAPTASPTTSSTSPSPTGTASPTPSASSTAPATGGFPAAPTSGADAGWLSGSSGNLTASGAHATWRGTPEPIARTWVTDDDPDATIKSGAEYGSWRGSIDVGLPGVSSVSDWADCATGGCDARWTTELTKLKTAWTSTDRGGGVLFIALAWEMNGDWFDHHVDPANVAAFTGSWKRFRALQQQVFPASKLVYNANRDTAGLSYDWRTAIPGWTDTADHSQVSKYVDVMAVDYYNDWASSSTTQTQFDSTSTTVDSYGAPVGIEAHRKLAQSVGLPLAVPEWSGDATGDGSTGDAASFPTSMHSFFAAHAGQGAGQVLYDVVFADQPTNSGKFVYYSTSQMPSASSAYQAAF